MIPESFLIMCSVVGSDFMHRPPTLKAVVALMSEDGGPSRDHRNKRGGLHTSYS